MPSSTPNLSLRKINPNTDGSLVVNIDTDFNDNWDKIDTAVSSKVNAAYVTAAINAIPAPVAPTWTNVTGKPTTFPPSTHGHAATEIIATGGVTVQAEIDSLKSSVSNGKNAVAAAITGMNQASSGSDTFAQMAAKISAISSDANATAGDVIAGKTFYQVSKKTGTMIDRGTVNYTPSTVNQSVAGGKHSGSGVVYGDANLIAPNILSGISIFGVTGTGGGREASGTIMSSSGQLNFVSDSGSSSASWHATVSGLSFTPSIIYINWSTSNFVTVYTASLMSPNSKIVVTNGSGSGSLYRLDGTQAYVNGTGFRLPIYANFVSVAWRAFE